MAHKSGNGRDNILLLFAYMNIHYTKRLIRHFLKARFWHGFGIHSPYVYHLQRHIISSNIHDDKTLIDKTKAYRRCLLNNKAIIKLNDLGTRNYRSGSVAQITNRTAIGNKSGRLLARLTHDYNPSLIIELGTSTGVSSAYLSLAAPPECSIITIEGSEECSAIAKKTMQKLSFGSNIQFLTGNFDNVLPSVAPSATNAKTLAYIDGNHTYEATLRYADILIHNAGDEMMMIFDDIHLSHGMDKAWSEICTKKEIATSLDLGRLGIAIIRNGCQKEHYELRN